MLPTNLCSNVKKFGVVFFLYFFKFLIWSIKNKVFQSDPINCRMFILCECSEYFSPKKNDIKNSGKKKYVLHFFNKTKIMYRQRTHNIFKFKLCLLLKKLSNLFFLESKKLWKFYNFFSYNVVFWTCMFYFFVLFQKIL